MVSFESPFFSLRNLAPDFARRVSLFSPSVTFPTAPHTEVSAKGDITYSEVVRTNVRKLEAYVAEMASGGKISPSQNVNLSVPVSTLSRFLPPRSTNLTIFSLRSTSVRLGRRSSPTSPSSTSSSRLNLRSRGETRLPSRFVSFRCSFSSSSAFSLELTSYSFCSSSSPSVPLRRGRQEPRSNRVSTFSIRISSSTILLPVHATCDPRGRPHYHHRQAPSSPPQEEGWNHLAVLLQVDLGLLGRFDRDRYFWNHVSRQLFFSCHKDDPRGDY